MGNKTDFAFMASLRRARCCKNPGCIQLECVEDRTLATALEHAAKLEAALREVVEAHNEPWQGKKTSVRWDAAIQAAREVLR